MAHNSIKRFGKSVRNILLCTREKAKNQYWMSVIIRLSGGTALNKQACFCHGNPCTGLGTLPDTSSVHTVHCDIHKCRLKLHQRRKEEDIWSWQFRPFANWTHLALNKMKNMTNTVNMGLSQLFWPLFLKKISILSLNIWYVSIFCYE